MSLPSISWRGETISQLVLGTAQFGMSYGIANSHGKPSDEEACELVRQVWTEGVNVFDTAQAYGESETVLGKALKSLQISSNAKVISKLSPSLSPKDADKIFTSVEDSIKELEVNSLWGLMLHRSECLDHWNKGLAQALQELQKKAKINYIGVSVYNTDEAKRAIEIEGIDIIQVPCSVWDQRMIKSGIFEYAKSKDKLCFVRSIYLQGLMFMNPDDVRKNLPSAYQVSLKWDILAKELKLSKAELAAKFAKTLNLPLVVGMETRAQILENIKIFSENALDSKTVNELSINLLPLIDEDLLNPSKWKLII